MEDGLPVEHFIEVIPLKKADANTIYETLIDCLKKKGVMISYMIGMGFDGACSHIFWETQWSSSPFNFCTLPLTAIYYNLLVQAANSTQGIKHVYTTLTTLWKYSAMSP